jgi:hypothetical protein
MALIADTHVDPVASLSPRYGPYKAFFFYSREGTAWSSHFKPGGSIVNKVTVPARWADFFTAKILTPEDLDWAKNLLQSRIWQIISELDISSTDASRTFALPRQCSSQVPPVCTLSVATLEATHGFLTLKLKGFRKKDNPTPQPLLCI